MSLRSAFARVLAGAWLLCAASCSIGETYFPDEETMKEFEEAGPITPELDLDQVLSGIPKPGAYRVVPGDVLEIRGAGGFLVPGTGGPQGGADVIQTRVQGNGTISLPLAGQVKVMPTDDRGSTLTEVENAVADALHPRFLAQRPAIVARVFEPAKVKVTVMGAVEKPGVIELSSDKQSLFGALSEAGGIIKASNLKTGARVINIRRANEPPGKAMALPVKGLNVPFADVALVGGETIEVNRWDPDLFTVIGLVKNPGAYEYPPGGRYNLMQALAIAGGLDRIADPPYATVFRTNQEGKIIAVTFGVSGDDLVQASAVAIRPGDVIAVEHTFGSWTRTFVSEVFRAQLNFFVDPVNGRTN